MAYKLARTVLALRIQPLAAARKFASGSGKAKKPNLESPVKASTVSPVVSKPPPAAAIPVKPKASAVSKQKAAASEIIAQVGSSTAVDNSDNTKYRCAEYYTFNTMSFYDLELRNQQYRIPQPSAISSS